MNAKQKQALTVVVVLAGAWWVVTWSPGGPQSGYPYMGQPGGAGPGQGGSGGKGPGQ